MSKTKAEIRDDVAVELGIKRINAVLQNEHVVKIEQTYDEVYAELKEDGLANWALAGEVPNQYVQSMKMLIADRLLNAYGVSNERYTRITEKASTAYENMQKYAENLTVSTEDVKDY